MGLRSVLVFCLLWLCSNWPVTSWGQGVPSVREMLLPSVATSPDAASASSAKITIPGPLRSFLRMAAVSQKVSPEDVLPLVAHNVVTDGYIGYGKGEKPTEYLVLLRRYVEQSRELLALAGTDGLIRIPNCEAAGPLLKVLGYRLMRPCGANAAVETAEAQRAFLTIDSGFPLTELEMTLREGKPFAYPYPAFQVPVIFAPNDWTKLAGGKRGREDVLDCLIANPRIARLYWAMSRVDLKTQASLRRSPGLERLLPLAPVLDFYGSDLTIRSGRVEVPGGSAAESAWQSLVGASPRSPGDFVVEMLTKDEGWVAAYFDALSRIGRNRQAYFTAPRQLERFYAALRGRDLSPSPVRPVFRPDAGLLLLTSRVQFEPDGRPHIPGNLDVWKEFLRQKSNAKLVRQERRRGTQWDTPEQLLEAMFAASRLYSEQGPLQTFLMMSDIDAERAPQARLTPQTVRLLADNYARFGDQYRVFCEFHTLDNAAITDFVRTAEAVDRIPNRALRADAIGLFQATLGLWQILARQGEIPTPAWSNSWRRVAVPFARVESAAQLYDVARSSLGELMRAAAGQSRISQEELEALLAGPRQTSTKAHEVELELANKIHAAFDSQRLISLDTLMALGDGLVAASQQKARPAALFPLAGQLREFQMPKPLFSSSEKSEWTPGLVSDIHLQAEMGTDLVRIIKSVRSPEEYAAARGLLVPFFRDSLVGLNYAYYAPPGNQLLANHPLLVRSHEFSGQMSLGGTQAWKTPSLVGRGWTAGGGAHMAGSLADLPYVLAELEQDFLVPENVQSLIWEDMAPTLLTSSILPRWWRVSEDELHAVALYQHLGEDLVRAGGKNDQRRGQVLDILEEHLPPQRFEQVDEALHAENSDGALARLAPGEVFYLGAEFHHRFSRELDTCGSAGRELESLAKHDPQAVRWERLSEDFGVPHPALAGSYARELLPLKPLPTYLGYSSRLLAESWDSNNLYWARLADEMGYPPVMLNVLAPELTRRMVAKIFATHLEDWPALLRALRETGEEFREGKEIAPPPETSVPGA